MLNDCTSGRCTSGNIPGEDALGVGDLFSLTFNVINLNDDGMADLRAGILTTVFDGITQATGDPVFTNGDVIREAFVTPEPSTGLLLASGIGGLALSNRRSRLGKERP